MLRFVLFLILAWVVVRLLRLAFYALTRSSSHGHSSRKSYGVGTTLRSSSSVDFKDVQDAEFEEIDDKPPK